MRGLCKNAEGCSAKILKGDQEKYWEVFCKNTKKCSVKYGEVFCKNTEGCFAKILKGDLQKYWEVFCKNTKKCSIEILRGVLWKYWGVFCKNTKKCSVKILRCYSKILKGFSQKYWKLNIEMYSAKILRGGLQKYWFVLKKYWEFFCKNIERNLAKNIGSQSAKISRCILPK